jgi:hypothetical protein
MDRLVAIALVSVLAAYLLARRPRMIWAQSSSGRVYFVKNLPDARRAADHLEALERRLVDFLIAAQRLVPHDARIRRIRERWNGTLSEVEDSKDNVAYSLGKTTVHICVREKDGSLADMNSALYVLYHELAHIATVSFGHTDLFWKNMRFLLELAEYVGAYKYYDHDAATSMLCDKKLGTNPLACVKRNTCPSEMASI